MLPFDFQLPTRIYFGPGKVNNIGKYLKPVGKKALIVTGKSSMRKLGVLDRVTGLLKKGGIESVVFEGIEPTRGTPPATRPPLWRATRAVIS